MDALRIIRIIIALLASLLLTSCSCGGSDNHAGGGIGGTGYTGTVNTTISDPPLCKAPIGNFSNVWVTITRVIAHTSSVAGPNDNGWVDLVDLRANPMQIDLLDLDSTSCIPTQLGSTRGIPAGQYQQIRLYLLSNSPSANEAKPLPNNCGSSGYNCVVVSGGAPETLQLSSEVQTGIRIPSGQIAGGRFTVPAGQTVNLNIDFDACSSIVLQVGGQYRLKPVLHAGEISLNQNAISGRVVDNSGGTPIGNAIVLIEQKDSENIDRVIMQKLTDSNGKFIFCPVPHGTYDVVVSAKNGPTIYNATITLGVGVGIAMGDIPLFLASGSANISGQVSAVITGLGQGVDIDISALKYATLSLRVTIPVLQGSTPTTVTTPTGIPSYNLYVPTGNPQAGTFSTTGTSYSAVSGDYFINAQASNCTQSSQSVGPLTENPVGSISAPPISFTGCSGN